MKENNKKYNVRGLLTRYLNNNDDQIESREEGKRECCFCEELKPSVHSKRETRLGHKDRSGNCLAVQ